MPCYGGTVNWGSPPSFLASQPLPPALAAMQVSIMQGNGSHLSWGPTIGAVCLRRAQQLHAQMLAEKLCMYEVLASHTRASSVAERGSEISGQTRPATEAGRLCGEMPPEEISGIAAVNKKLERSASPDAVSSSGMVSLAEVACVRRRQCRPSNRVL